MGKPPYPSRNLRRGGWRDGLLERFGHRERRRITELTIATWPWLVTMLVFLAMVTYIPELSLWLPRLLGML